MGPLVMQDSLGCGECQGWGDCFWHEELDFGDAICPTGQWRRSRSGVTRRGAAWLLSGLSLQSWVSGWCFTPYPWVWLRCSDTGARYGCVKSCGPSRSWSRHPWWVCWSPEVPGAACQVGWLWDPFLCAACLPGSVLVFFQVLFTMARRPRSSRAWHFVLSAARRDADTRTMALAGTSDWGYDSDGQVGLSGRMGWLRERWS